MKKLSDRKSRLGGAIYILPNLLTTGNLFFGFFSIVKSLNGQYYAAALAILLASVFDVLDGRVARLTKGTSQFGVQYDSLCDLVSFGLAPAFLMYQFGLNELGRIGWIACFLFLACGALRLARFNVLSSIGKSSGDFIGLPIPMAAGVIACFVAMVSDLSELSNPHWIAQQIKVIAMLKTFRIGFLIVTGPLLAFAMVCNLPYRSHKAVKIKGIKPFRLLVVLVGGTAFIALQPEFLGFAIFTFYALSGPFEWLVGWKRAEEEDEIFAEDEHSVIVESEDHPGTMENDAEHEEEKSDKNI